MIQHVLSGSLFCSLLMATLVAAEQPSITVFAAASTTDVLTVIAKRYEADQGVKVVCSFGSSSMLAKQIEQGAPADIFIAADQQWMDQVDKKGLIKAGRRKDLLENGLVIVAPKGHGFPVRVEASFDFAGAFTGLCAMGDPTHVPVGIYAQEACVHLGWWKALSQRVAPAIDARAALKLVEISEVDVGIVYATDARASKQVETLAVIPASLHTPIRYPMALMAQARPETAAFMEYLRGTQAAAVFTGAGFTMVQPDK